VSNRESITQHCDGEFCQSVITTDGTRSAASQSKWRHFDSHSEAWKVARRQGWYIADRDLCPSCREKVEVPS